MTKKEKHEKEHDSKEEKEKKEEIKEVEEEIEKVEKEIEQEIEEESNKILSNLWIIGTIFLIIGLVIGLIAGSVFYSNTNGTTISKDEAKLIAKNTLEKMVNEQLKATGMLVSFNITANNVEDIGNFYNVSLTISLMGRSQEVNVYVTKDGNYVTPLLLKAVKSYDAKAEAKKLYEIKNKTEKPKIIVAVMANCPFGNQVEPLIKEIVDLFGDKIEVEPRYIFYSGKNQYTGEYEKGADNKNYWSLHGNYEMDEGILEYIIWKLYGTKTWIDFVNKVNQQCLQYAPNSTKVYECALNVAKEMGLNVTEIQNYYKTHKKEIIQQQYELTSKIGINGSPTIIINGEVYKGPRTAEALKEAICSAFITPPPECNETLSNQEIKATGSCG
ncbi:MAG: thioredoxin domain-containing protein [Nanoarchaeota archaeon]